MFQIRLLWARFTGALEGLWPALWPGVPAAMVFTAVGLLGGWRIAPLWLHLPILLALVAVFIWTLWRLMRAFRWPNQRDGLIRLERASALAFQPLRKRSAGPAHGNDVSQALWRAHLERMDAAKAAVKAPRPRLSWAQYDRFAFAPIALITLVLGLLIAGRDIPERLAQSFLPDLGGAPASAIVTVTATPPDYVGTPPILLSAFSDEERAAQEMPLPAGTMLMMSLEGGWRTPVLSMAGRDIPFEPVGDQRYALDIGAVQSNGFEVRQGGRVQFRWDSPIIADQPPAIAFSDMPKRTTNHAIQVSYEVFDDYGVEGVALVLTPQEAPDARERLTVPTPTIEPGELETRSVYKDLTASQWAGRKVTLVLEAVDGLEQKGISGPLEAILPERPFTHPLARQIIAQRKRLFFEVGSRLSVATNLSDMSSTPSQFDDSLWVFAMLRSAFYRLAKHSDPAIVQDITQQLWAIATFLEDGGLTADRDALRKSLEEMMSALESQDAQAFDTLAQQLERKIAEMMARQMQQMQKQEASPQSGDGTMRMIDSSTLDRMMQQMRDLAAAGDMAGAMQMLEAIQSLMENLDASPGPSAESLAQAQAAQQALDDLNALIDNQRDLMNETVRQALDQSRQSRQQPQGAQGQSPSQSGSQQQGQGEGQSQNESIGQAPSPNGPAGQFGALGRNQTDLQGQGEDIAKRLGEAGIPGPQGLSDATENMGNAAGALDQGRGLPALREQADALRNLTNAQTALESQLDQMMQQIRSQSSGRDPFGRPNANGSFMNGQVKIPTDAEAKRARDIRNELQRRLGDPDRSTIERSYLRRLLERFSR